MIEPIQTLIGFLIGALSYFLLSRLIEADYKRRENIILKNVKTALGKDIKEEVFEDE